ncbi:retrovirus-related pol polyprotein from transposon TNT 1-94 [Tanacetum coccineum]
MVIISLWWLVKGSQRHNGYLRREKLLTYQRLKSLIMSVLPDDQINSVINCLTAKSIWDDLILYHEGPSDVKEIRDSQDSLDDEEDTRRSQEYMNDLEEEYQARALLAKSKRFFKKGTQRFSSAKATDQTECHKCGKKGHFARDCFSKTSVPSYQSPFQNNSQPKFLSSSQRKLEEEEVSSDDNEMVGVKALMALADDENVAVGKESAKNAEWVKISIRKKRILRLDQLTEEPSSSGQTDLIFLKYLADDIEVSIPAVSQIKATDPLVAITDSSASEHDLANESSVCSTPFPPLEKIVGAEPVSEPMTIKSILKSKSTFKAETLKGVIIKESSSAPAKVNKDVSASKINSAPADYERTDHRTCDHAEYMSIMNMSQHLKGQGGSSSRSKTPRPSKHFFPPYIYCGFNDHLSDDCVNNPICDICESCDHDTHGHNRIISLKRGIKPRNPQHVTTSYETCGSIVYTTTDHNDIEWFKRGEALQAKKAEALKTNKIESTNANRSKTSTKSGCSRHITGVKSYLYKYVEQPGPKFDEKRGTIFNSNKEIVMIAPRVKDVYVLDMTSSKQASCFFAKATENLNWHWHKRLAHLNFKTINKLAKQNLVIGLPSLVYSKDKPCSSCEKGKHHRASFKTKQTSSIKKCLHLLHMDLFEPITPRSINHEKYTLVIVDEYSRTLIEAARTMLSGSVFSKQYWTEAVATACCTQNSFIYNHKNYLGKFDEKANDDYFLGYSLISKAFRVFNTRRQQIEETCHITFDESINVIKFTKSSNDNITIDESERYPPDKYLHLYEPSQRYQVNSNAISFIDPYERPESVIIETDVSSDQHDQAD